MCAERMFSMDTIVFNFSVHFVEVRLQALRTALYLFIIYMFNVFLYFLCRHTFCK